MNPMLGVRGRAPVGEWSGVARIRLALVAWMQEVYPEATSATLMLILPDDDFSAVDAVAIPDRLKWPGWPRAAAARERLRRITLEVYPESLSATVVFYLGTTRSGTLPIPLAPPAQPDT